MRMRWILCAQLWACQALAIEPGQGFAVHLDWPLVAQHIQRVEPVALQFRVEQCDHFRTAVQHRAVYDGGASAEWRQVSVQAEPDGHGRFVAQLSVDALLDEAMAGCWADAENPDRQELRLAVTCDGDGRQATSAPIPLVYAPATHRISHWGSEVFGMEVVHGNRLVLATAAGVHMVHPDLRTAWGGVPEVSQNVGLGGGSHAMAHTATHAYVASDCLYPRCAPMTAQDPVTHAQVTLESADVFSIDLRRPYDPNDRALISGMVQVPGPIVHLFADSDGSVLVVSRAPALPSNTSGDGLGQLGGWWTPGVVVSRITGDTVVTEAVFDNEAPVGGEMTSTGVFLTGDYNRLLHMRRVQTPHDGMRLQLGPTDVPWAVWPSPSGHHWLVGGEHRDDLCEAASGQCHPLESAQKPGVAGHLLRPAWLSDGVARLVSTGEKIGVEIFNLDGSLRGSATRTPQSMSSMRLLQPVLALSGDRIAVAEPNAVRIFDRMGRLQGGTVLPPNCGAPATLMELPGNRIVWISTPPMPSVYIMDLDALN